MDLVFSAAKKEELDLEQLEYMEFMEYCEEVIKKHVNRERPADENFDMFLGGSRWRLDKPQEPKPL
jgi:hypothetical protein